MVTLAGYQDFVRIHDSANSQVYRARRTSDRQSVILKFLNRDYPTSAQIRRYKQEYRLTNQLNSPGIVKAYSLEEWHRSYAIAFEDFGGISLKQWLKEREKLSLQEFLDLAIAIVESLEQIHAQNIIHKDLNPANIVFNPESKELKIIDFGIATQLSRETPVLKNPNVLEGTLAYISPEQTGRMNRSLDYRTDFYSLGVTFYELLIGKLPFDNTDPLELVHCHIAKNVPVPDSSLVSPLLDLAIKLMSKNAEDRYQSTWGIKEDLNIFLNQLEKTGKVAPFPLGQQDIPERFQISQKLYGREQETDRLLTTFKRVCETGNVELVLVSGYSGVGKSSLVQELYKSITAHQGYFISGKFDRFQRNIPYSAAILAFRKLINQLLGEPEAQLQIWREKLLWVLGNNGQLIIDIIPEIELIIGKQPPVPAVGANEAKNRFNLVLSDFIYSFCDLKHPLTLFLDDLQWADLASLKLLERLLFEREKKHILLLGAYRDNEVSAHHPLSASLEKLKQGNAKVTQIMLNNLSLDRVSFLIGDTLNKTPASVQELANLVLQKTGGNPFFINKFLQTLHDEGLLKFQNKSRSWQWDLKAIQVRDFTNNVVELMVEKLKKLPQFSQDILSLAACWGTEFNLQLLTWVQNKSSQDIFQALSIALQRELIFPLSELDENLLIQSYKFGHDRIQQAAYNLIPDDRKAIAHYHIGRSLLQNADSEVRESIFFELVNQLNYGKSLIICQKERDKVAQFNLLACRQARSAAAYQAASEYAKVGLSLLGKQAWSRQYKMSLAFHNLATELASLCGDLETMDQFIETVDIQAKSLLDTLDVCRIRILSNVSRNQLTEAIILAQEFLKKLGIAFPDCPTQNDIQQEILEIEKLIGDRKIGDLLHLPMMEDSEKIAIVEIANSIIPAAYMSASVLFPLIVSLPVKLSIQYGNTSVSASAYAPYGIVACNLFKDVNAGMNIGIQFGNLALQLIPKLDRQAFKPEILHVFGMFILHRKSHLKETLPLFEEGHEIALEVGNLEYVGYTAEIFCFYAFSCGQSLDVLEQKAHAYYNKLIRFNQLIQANHCQICWQSILRLRGISEELSIRVKKTSQTLYFFHLYKLISCYLFGEIESALSHTLEIKRYLVAAAGTVGEPLFYFYASLAAIANLNSQSEKRSTILQQVEKNQVKLQQLWAQYAPMNYQHKVDLVEAEKCRILGKKIEAIELYNQAIAGAKTNEYIQEEALASELAAKFYLDWNQEKVARIYMRDAHYCYSCWGAIAKVKELEECYPQLCQSLTTNSFSSNLLNTRTIENSTGSSVLDLKTVIKSTNAISSEIVLDKLLAALMNNLVENAGAQRGILILPRGDRLFVEATKEAESEEVEVLQSLSLHEFARLSSKIVHYVARTGETVVLSNAINEGSFTDDDYICKYQCRSIACTPLSDRGQLQGIIYLENNLTTGAFTQERMALLRTLATQAAISLENARLYENITTLNTAYERFIPSQFLSFLNKESIVDVKLGDRVEREMTVLFSDIRDFTTLSEQMNPTQNFAFINEYLGYMEPKIQNHGGFIDKYIGDAIMALFPNSADEAVQGSLAMLNELRKYNQKRCGENLQPLQIGIGLHTGRLMLGTVGGLGRMDGTVIGDAVNLSSRVEGLTKTYGVSLLITDRTLTALSNPLDYEFRFIDKVKAKGKKKAASLFEIFSADPPELRSAKIATKEKFERAVLFYHQKLVRDAASLFQECIDAHESDRAACIYLERCKRYMT